MKGHETCSSRSNEDGASRRGKIKRNSQARRRPLVLMQDVCEMSVGPRSQQGLTGQNNTRGLPVRPVRFILVYTNRGNTIHSILEAKNTHKDVELYALKQNNHMTSMA